MNTVFSLDCFHFNDLKKVLSIVLENLGDLSDKYNSLNHKFSALDIPDTSKIMIMITELEKKQKESDRKQKYVMDDLDSFKLSVNNNMDELSAGVQNLEEKDTELEERIIKLE